MKILKLIDKMGGITHINLGNSEPVKREELTKFLDTKNKIFEDWLIFLENFGSGVMFKKSYDIQSYKEHSEYVHEETSEIPNFPFSGLDIGSFYGEGLKVDESNRVSTTLLRMDGRLPEGFLPIADDTFGGLILLNTNNDDSQGAIYFWDGSNDPDPDEHFEDYGEVMLEEMRMQNMYLIGTDFYDFLSRMLPSST